MATSALATRRLVHALRRLPLQSGSNPPRNAHSKPLVWLQLNQRRAYFWRRSSDNDDGKADPPDKSDGATSSDAAKEPNAQEDAVVPVNGAQLRRDTESPFEPRLLGLPLLRRPLFPGQQQLLQLTNENAIKEVKQQFEDKKPLFVGAFLRHDDPALEDGSEMPNNCAEDLSDKDPMKALYHLGTRGRIVQVAPFMVPGQGSSSPSQGLQVLIYGHDLIRLDKVLQLGPPLELQVSKVRRDDAPQSEGSEQLDEVKALINETMHTIREIMKINPQFREHAALIHQGMQRLQRDDPRGIAYFAAQLTTASGPELMQVLEMDQPSDKLRKVLTLVKKELEVSQLQQKITTQIEEKIGGHQREFMLREQLKAIKKELGEDKSDGSDKLLKKFTERLDGKNVPADVKEAIDSEIEKFSGLAKESQEYQITRNYLDWLTILPWGVHSNDTLSLQKARAILDKDHYGLGDVKERILELIAVGNLRGTIQGKIVCFVGPPGVGKTSIGKSIAQALGRKFYRFSVGGLYDVAEIKGHRRTYVGAMPGKVVQCLKKTQSANPLVLIDEVDKIGRGHQGDPASALLELLDPSQNGSFLDHYLDVPVDASKVLFVCTANVTDTIPGPLLDRMEVIRLSGYDLQEKVKIATDYLVPTAMREMGLWPQIAEPTNKAEVDDQSRQGGEKEGKDRHELKESDATETPSANSSMPNPEGSLGASDVASSEGLETMASIESEAIEALIRWYCREAGVRNLQKHIEKICRKLAMKVVESQEASAETAKGEADSKPAEAGEESTSGSSLDLIVTADGLDALVGKPPFTSDRLYEGPLPVGTVTGLAWTAMGGSVLYMEASALPKTSGNASTPSLSVTGQLGSVMKESSQLALLIARRYMSRLELSERKSFFEENEIHIHCPEGATPKDGPSAGVTMVTALLSLGLDTPARVDLAMTGEVSLNGKVLPIGGVKEKTIAARRAGCKALVFPQANRRDFDELPTYLKDGLDVYYASDYEDVFAVAFPDVRAP